MKETSCFFEGGPQRLFGVLHLPEKSTRTPVVFCHPFGEEKLWTHRVFVSFARTLAAKGHPVLRFDCTGNGDSEGDFSSSSLRTCVDDTHAAVEMLKQTVRSEEVMLVGLRLGASVAALTAEARDDVQRLVLWSPIIDGAQYAQELLRINLTTQMAVYREIRWDRAALARILAAGRTVNVDGYELGPDMWRDLNGLRLAAEPKRFAGPCLIVQIDREASAVVSPAFQALQRTYGRADLRTAQEEPFWKEIQRFYAVAPNLSAVTLDWLETA